MFEESECNRTLSSMYISSLSSPYRKAALMSSCTGFHPCCTANANNSLRESYRTTGAYISSKSMPGRWENPWATNRALYLVVSLNSLRLMTKIHLQPYGVSCPWDHGPYILFFHRGRLFSNSSFPQELIRTANRLIVGLRLWFHYLHSLSNKSLCPELDARIRSLDHSVSNMRINSVTG